MEGRCLDAGCAAAVCGCHDAHSRIGASLSLCLCLSLSLSQITLASLECLYFVRQIRTITSNLICHLLAPSFSLCLSFSPDGLSPAALCARSCARPKRWSIAQTIPRVLSSTRSKCSRFYRFVFGVLFPPFQCIAPTNATTQQQTATHPSVHQPTSIRHTNQQRQQQQKRQQKRQQNDDDDKNNNKQQLTTTTTTTT